MVAPGDVERIELERAEPLDDDLAPTPGRRAATGRRQQVAADEEAAGGSAVDGRFGHRRIVRGFIRIA